MAAEAFRSLVKWLCAHRPATYFAHGVHPFLGPPKRNCLGHRQARSQRKSLLSSGGANRASLGGKVLGGKVLLAISPSLLTPCLDQAAGNWASAEKARSLRLVCLGCFRNQSTQ